MQLENAITELKTTDNLMPFMDVNPYKEPLSKAEQYVLMLAQPKGEMDTSLTADEILTMIRDLNHDYLDLKAREDRLKKQKEEYPSYCLEYKETTQDDKHTIISSDLNSDCENLYDFFIKVFEKISYDIKLTANTKSDITPITTALQEALANCLINADYYGSNGVVVMKDDESITISNPGGFRVELDAARAGGISDPRNTAIMRMFNLIGIGSNDGFGISNIFSVWKSHELVLPVIEESFNPESITLKLSFVPESKSTKTQISQNRPDIETDRQDAVISYITDNITVTSKEISELLGISHKKSKQLLHRLMAKDFVIIKNGKYTLKA